MAILDNLTDQIYAFQIFKLLAFKLYSAKLLKNSKKMEWFTLLQKIK